MNNILRFVEAVGFLYNGAFSYIGNSKYRIIDVKIVDDVKVENRHLGKVLFIEDGCPIVICGKGLLKLTKILDHNNKNIIPLSGMRFRFI